ncbi:hypothetical protein ACFQAT_07975 [Undibacterium arcticum]|uniref:Uncharacterized protein n=1 Tax=Undibacterium arcticum TaxID=1762892 RepID=A0ABV7EZN7_9BURK
MKNKSALLAGILAGMSSPATIYAQPSYPRLVGSDMERLRGDVSRVGNDFSTVIDSEHAKEQAASYTK